jgi:hypothetical protein
LLGARPMPECGSLHNSSHIKPDNHHNILIMSMQSSLKKIKDHCEFRKQFN